MVREKCALTLPIRNPKPALRNRLCRRDIEATGHPMRSPAMRYTRDAGRVVIVANTLTMVQSH